MEKSPQHGRNVSLVLDLTTGLVSPKFHVKHDPSFDVVQQQFFKPNWQTEGEFMAKREKQIRTENNLLPYPKSKTKSKNVTHLAFQIRHQAKFCQRNSVLPLLIYSDLNRQKKVDSRKSRSLPEGKNITAARHPYKRAISTKYLKHRPTYTTRSTTSESRHKAILSFTLSTLVQAHQVEISLANKHTHHVSGEILCCTTQFPDQDGIKDQTYDLLYSYKTTSD